MASSSGCSISTAYHRPLRPDRLGQRTREGRPCRLRCRRRSLPLQFQQRDDVVDLQLGDAFRPSRASGSRPGRRPPCRTGRTRPTQGCQHQQQGGHSDSYDDSKSTMFLLRDSLRDCRNRSGCLHLGRRRCPMGWKSQARSMCSGAVAGRYQRLPAVSRKSPGFLTHLGRCPDRAHTPSSPWVPVHAFKGSGGD